MSSKLNLKKRPVFVLLYCTLFAGISCEDQSNNQDVDPVSPEDSTSSLPTSLPVWEEGYLEIHAINTGRGECAFFILPDGTTMLVDAASSLISPSNPIPPPPARPNSNISSGQAIADYINHFITPTNNDVLNYILLSHFHPDHMGGYSNSSDGYSGPLPMAPSGDFRMGGVTEVGAKIPFEKIIDRGYPNYDYPINLLSAGQTGERMRNYVKFIDWAKSTYSAKAEQFDVGRDDQISLRRNPSKYTNFQIRNIVGNGKVWSGSGTGSVNTLPPLQEMIGADPNLNIFSTGFELTYGKFNYFSAGDLQYTGKSTYPWMDIEAPVAGVMTEVDILKANHHGTKNCNSGAFLDKLSPSVILVHTWRDIQPNPQTIGRVFEENSLSHVFTTNMTEANKGRLGAFLPRFKSLQGHIVVRVHPGGGKYTIYTLDDSDQNYHVKKVFGPYTSK